MENGKRFSVILATNHQHVLGIHNELPWKNSDDLQYFREVTTYSPYPDTKNIIICGRKTWESFGCRKLPGRTLFVVTSKASQLTSNASVFFLSSFDKAVEEALRLEIVYKVWVIGGRSIYLQAFHHPLCGDVYWNKITAPIAIKDKSSIISLRDSAFHTHSSTNVSDVVKARIGSIGGLETQYLRLMKDCMLRGERRATRNATTLSLFDRSLSWDMDDGFPLLTTKKMFWKGIVEELLFFIRGDTQTKLLEEKGIRIWKGNTTREFLDRMGFTKYTEGEMGPMYGYQWRYFGKPYNTTSVSGVSGVDQLISFIKEISRNPNSRRHLLTTYNPAQVHEGVLYPCHSLVIQAYVSADQRLNIKMYQRSADVFLGLPFNIASTSLFCVIISKLCNLKPGSVSITLGDAHIYETHLDACKEQLSRECYTFPTLETLKFQTLEEVENSELKDYKLNDYKYHPRIAAAMVA